jgi:hypothetical protein
MPEVINLKVGLTVSEVPAHSYLAVVSGPVARQNIHPCEGWKKASNFVVARRHRKKETGVLIPTNRALLYDLTPSS